MKEDEEELFTKCPDEEREKEDDQDEEKIDGDWEWGGCPQAECFTGQLQNILSMSG